MSTGTREDDPKYLKAYDQGLLRSAFVSLFWGVIMERRKNGSFTMLSLAKKLGANKGEVSRWFSTQPNWTINTISNIANALDLDIEVRAVDRNTGIVYTPSGVEHPSHQSFATPTNPSVTNAGADQRLEASTLTRSDSPRR
jgi:DNA-binding phage protein